MLLPDHSILLENEKEKDQETDDSLSKLPGVDEDLLDVELPDVTG